MMQLLAIICIYTSASKYGIILCFPHASCSNNNLDQTKQPHRKFAFHLLFGFVLSFCARRWCHRAGNSLGMVWHEQLARLRG